MTPNYIEPLALTCDELDVLHVASRRQIVTTATHDAQLLASMACVELLRQMEFIAYDIATDAPIAYYELTALGRASLMAAKAGLN